MPVSDYPELAENLCATCRRFGERGWCRATSGNFSLRVATDNCMITRSGREKSRLSVSDLMLCNLAGETEDADHRPSAETPLHTCLYRLDGEICAVLHTHSVASTVLSRAAAAYVHVSGFEMQKAIAGIRTHETAFEIPVFENRQDMESLAAQVEESWNNGKLQNFGFLMRGHGLFVMHVDSKVYSMLCEKDDLISVPAGTRHWFDMGPNPTFTAIRLFNNPDGWVAKFTGDDIADRFPLLEN